MPGWLRGPSPRPRSATNNDRPTGAPMLRNYFAAAFGNLGRNWLYAGITILGLAASFAAAILIGLYLRDEYSFDRFVPDYQRIYRLETDLTWPGGKPIQLDAISGVVAGQLRLDFPQV